MNEVWNLDPIYRGFEDPAFARDMEQLAALVEGYREFAASLPGMDAEIGYYGRADFVQHVSLAEMEDYTVTICVRDGMISKDDPNSSAFVIAVSSQLQRDSCVLMVERIGDPSWDVSDEPWIVYEPTVELMQYSLPEGTGIPLVP